MKFLAEVLHALAGDTVTMERVQKACKHPLLFKNHKVYTQHVSGWHFDHDTILEMMECLQTRNLCPSDDSRRLFAQECWYCDNGTVAVSTGDGSFGTLEPEACSVCEGRANVFVEMFTKEEHLVRWAALGTEVILQAEELARESARRLIDFGYPQSETVVWNYCERKPRMSYVDSIFAVSEFDRTHELRCPSLEQEAPLRSLKELGIGVDDFTEHGIVLLIPNL